MILTVLTFVYVACDAIAIISGAIVLTMLMSGELFGNLAVLCLKSALATSVTGLLFRSNHRILPTHLVSMLTLFAAGLAILAWRRYRLAGVWRSIFAFATTVVLYLSAILLIIPMFKRISPSASALLTQYDFKSLVMLLSVLALFVLLGIAAVRTSQANC